MKHERNDDDAFTDRDREVLMTRRRFLKSLAGGAIVVGGLMAVHGTLIEPRWLEVTWHEIQVRGLPLRLDGFTIAHITDLHTHHFGHLEAQVIQAIAQIEPDLVALTGDMVETFADLDAFKHFLTELSHYHVETVATLGNWEHSEVGLVEKVQEIYREYGIRLMINESVRLDSGLVVAATDDSSTGHANLQATLSGVSTRPGRIFLTHGPGIFYEQQVYDMPFDLALAGHTHGGQVRLGPWRPAASGHYVAGHYYTMLGRAYVSRGIGTTNLPIRFMCRPELPIFHLRRC